MSWSGRCRCRARARPRRSRPRSAASTRMRGRRRTCSSSRAAAARSRISGPSTRRWWSAPSPARAIPVISAVGPRDRHHALRLRRRPPRADADRRRRDGGAGARRACWRRSASSATGPSAAPGGRRERGAEQLRRLLRHWPEREALLAPQRQRLDDLAERLPRGLQGRLDRRAGRARPCRRRASARPAQGARRMAAPRNGSRRSGGWPSSPIPIAPGAGLCADRGPRRQDPDLRRRGGAARRICSAASSATARCDGRRRCG